MAQGSELRTVAKPGSAMLLGLFLIILCLTLGMLFGLAIPQVYMTKQMATRALDLAAIAGATQRDEAALLLNIARLDKPRAEATTREYARRNLAASAQFMAVSPTLVANTPCAGAVVTDCTLVTISNLGELDPWTGAVVSSPTVFVETPFRLKDIAGYAAAGSGVGSISANPLNGAEIRIRVKASFRLRT